MFLNAVMSNDTWYGVTLMFRLRYYWNTVMSNATYNVHRDFNWMSVTLIEPHEQ